MNLNETIKNIEKYSKAEIIEAIRRLPLFAEELLRKLEDNEMRTMFKKADEARQKEIDAIKAFANWKTEVIKKYGDGNSVQLCSLPRSEIEKGAALEEALKKSTRARIEAEGKEDRLTRRFL